MILDVFRCLIGGVLMNLKDTIDMLELLVTIVGLFFIWKQLKDGNEQSTLLAKQLSQSEKRNNIIIDNKKRETSLEMLDYYRNILNDDISALSYILSKHRDKIGMDSIEYTKISNFDGVESVELFEKDCNYWKNFFYKTVASDYSSISDIYRLEFRDSYDRLKLDIYEKNQ